MMDIVEKVARALCDDTLKRWRSPLALKTEPWREFIPAARAAIEAMREPTEMMVWAGASHLDIPRDPDSLRRMGEAYTFMIDHAGK